MKGLLFVLYFISFLGSIICFFWALQFRTDKGEKGPSMPLSPDASRRDYGPKGGKIAFIGTICFLVSGCLGALFYLLD